MSSRVGMERSDWVPGEQHCWVVAATKPSAQSVPSLQPMLRQSAQELAWKTNGANGQPLNVAVSSVLARIRPSPRFFVKVKMEEAESQMNPGLHSLGESQLEESHEPDAPGR